MSWALLGMAGVLVPVSVLVWAMARSAAQREEGYRPKGGPANPVPPQGGDVTLPAPRASRTLPTIPVHHAAGAAMFLRSVRPPFVPWSPGMKVPCRPPETAEKRTVNIKSWNARDLMLRAQRAIDSAPPTDAFAGTKLVHPFRSTGSDL